ncbi:MAG: DNA repair ATPase [Myxococcota bacterium]|jgi:hypothetical protein|nr:DNA repair ATPase [Myxococcota bacterium]
MAISENAPSNPKALDPARLEGGAYEVIRGRLAAHANALRECLTSLNTARKAVFGSIEHKLTSTSRIATANNCVPRDIASVGERLLFGYNVQLGLRAETEIADVFAIYSLDNDSLRDVGLDLLSDPRFAEDLRNLYRYYKKARFARFATSGNKLFMVFQVGEDVSAIKSFKWLRDDFKGLVYADNRSDHELPSPLQHEVEWKRTVREQHRKGEHPHISIEDKVFVEAIDGDITIKVEDNTATGAGIYAEPVENKDQTLDDAEIQYAILGDLVLLKIRPYGERDVRHIVFSAKAEQARRLDALAQACVLLPDDHGFIFPAGYFLQTGEHKLFDNDLKNLRFVQRIASPNGEDTLFSFLEPQSGTFVLLIYNLIEQRVETPTVCNGFALLEDGRMVCFRADPEPQKHHAVQVWQTPFVGPNYALGAVADSYLYKIGNRDIVRAMAGCRHVLGLVDKDESYANVYVDITKESAALLDTYFWLDSKEAFAPGEPLQGVHRAACAAIEEFDKVVRVRKDTASQLAASSSKVKELLRNVGARRYESLTAYVEDLCALRKSRGEVIALKDLRYAQNAQIEALDLQLAQASQSLSARTVSFLLEPASLDPYQAQLAELAVLVPLVEKVSGAEDVETRIDEASSALELLVETMSNLEIKDATQRTGILERLSDLLADLNRIRATLRGRVETLSATEGRAEFSSQMRLLDQAVVGFLDVCDTPQRCEEYLQKMSVQLSDIEGKFAAYDAFMVELATKRTDITEAFESRKVALLEARSRKTDSLMRSAQRVLEGIETRAARLTSNEEIAGYFASDLLVAKVRDIAQQLAALGDNVKADDLAARLKAASQEAQRQLKDKQELYEDGASIIKLGQHRFSVSTHDISVSVLPRDGALWLHLSGTKLFERVPDEIVAQTRAVWDQSLVSENSDIYRGEYLAYSLLTSPEDALLQRLEAARAMSGQELITTVRELMGPRFEEGYTKGVHDSDAAKILAAMLELRAAIGLLRHNAQARCDALLFWRRLVDPSTRSALEAMAAALSSVRRFAGHVPEQEQHVANLASRMTTAFEKAQYPVQDLDSAASYLFKVLLDDAKLAISSKAAELYEGVQGYLERRAASDVLARALETSAEDLGAGLRLARSTVLGYCQATSVTAPIEAVSEAATWLLCGGYDRRFIVSTPTSRTLEGMVGTHPRMSSGRYELEHGDFLSRLATYHAQVVPLFERHAAIKRRLLDDAAKRLKIEEMKPKILTSFVRNRLVDTVYLPLVGANLAKQIGVAGANTRTDRMGLLLLVSPPGYGKTTLMEYVASRLGLVFMKVNGPAIGSKVTSLDPAEAPNAAAREQIERLNLAFEMGDNTMIYLDDIQHLSPELLQKFISLCDGQRKIEGVYQGHTRTYDLRGRKVCVVMAGNPYSESGEAFKIPDMLANRADTYNLGEIIGGNPGSFELSYLENAATSNAHLSRIASRSHEDFLCLCEAARTGSRDSLDLKVAHSPEELTESFSVLRGLLRIRDVVLIVNREYIRSAAQSDDYRTEPPFKLQGSYRNMNRMSEKVSPLMNDAEVEQVIRDHYRSEAQTLTVGAEANLLKLDELLGQLSPEGQKRWDEIKRTFDRNLLLRSAGAEDRMGQIVAQLSAFGDGLTELRKAIQGTARRADEN